MKKHPAHIDPDLPAGTGDVLGRIVHSEEFDVPKDYFAQARSEIILKSVRQEPVPEDDFFEKQASIIRLKTLRKESNEELLVPQGYFEKGIAIQTSSSPGQGRIFNLKWITIPAAAAAILIAFWILRPSENEIDEFALLLEMTDIDIEDLEYFAETDDLAALYLESYSDTLIIDSTSVSIDLVHDSLIFQEIRPNAADSIALPDSKQKKQTPVSFDELTEEEILEFLLEEGGDDLFEDL
ncbi:MAG: hypothetical protein RL220_223 [Bacteroidota bacterium]